MAGLKKKKKDKSGSPNTVLVVFLVIFVLSTIGAVVWGYYGYEGQERLRQDRVKSDGAEKAARLTSDYYEGFWLDLRDAIGDKVDGDDLTVLTAIRDEFAKPGYGKFKDQKRNDAAKKLMENIRENLALDKAAKTYDKNFITEYQALKARVEDVTGQLKKQADKNIRVEAEFRKWADKQDASHAAATTSIQKGNQAALDEAKKKSKAFEDLVAQLADRAAAITELNTKIGVMEEDFAKELKKRELKIRDLIAESDERKKDEMRGAQNVARGDSAPLLLDVSPGKPLWDSPVAKIIRVEADLRTVMINVGTAQGAKPELTFNIFAASSSNRAIGKLKGTIEVVKVVDSSTSIARVTSLYDSEGNEIGFNDPIRGRVARETESPIKEGDLLFNMFWGTRVAIAGYVSVTGEPSDNPAEQFQQMQDFIYLLQRQGMTVDAYVDLRDGSIKGKITGKTRYLIRGDDQRMEREKPAVKPADGDDPKEPAAKEAPNANRNETINAANGAMRREAIDKGLLVISAENFAAVIGYRRVHSANQDVRGFRPTLPEAGTNIGGPNAGRAAAPMPEQKKAPEPEMKKADPDN